MGDFLDEVARTRDSERVVVIGHAATRFALDHLVNGEPFEDLVVAPFEWQEGWVFALRW